MNTKEKIKILYIDDEANNLISFKATFRFDYNVLIANSTEEAHAHLRQNEDIVVILCDQRMPDKTGVEFFEEIRDVYPNPIRILLTGYTDIESVIDAINRGHIFRYLKKPWTDVDLQSAIEEAYKYYVTSSLLVIKNEQLQKAYNELDKFAYSVTHDMRGPLLSVLGAIELGKTVDDLGELKEMLDMMEKAVNKLDAFIQSMHEYYNLKRGESQIATIDFTTFVKDVADMYEITGKVSNIQFDTKVDQKEDFRTDETSLKIVLNNLLSNAFKYQKKNNGEKFVKLDIMVEKGNATITVADNGIGIPEESIDQVFKMFYRATSEEVGSGFGLYNVKEALAKVNGEIKVESKLNEGTTFTAIIPGK